MVSQAIKQFFKPTVIGTYVHVHTNVCTTCVVTKILFWTKKGKRQDREYWLHPFLYFQKTFCYRYISGNTGMGEVDIPILVSVLFFCCNYQS